MKHMVEDALEFLLKTAGGLFILFVLVIVIFLAVFWPKPEVDDSAWLGLVARDVDARTVQQFQLPFSRGVRVDQVFPNTPADFSNVAPGDYIVSFNNTPISGQTQLLSLIREAGADEQVLMTVYRDGSYYNVAVKLGQKPNNVGLPAQTVAQVQPVGGPAAGASGQVTAPPITTNANMVHPYRGVCVNCHVILSNASAGNNAQLVAALRGRQAALAQPSGNQPGLQWQQPAGMNQSGVQWQPPTSLPPPPSVQWLQPAAAPALVPQTLPARGLPGATSPVPLSEFNWAGIGLESFNPANAAALGMPANITGVQVDDVTLNSRGAKAGLKSGDLIQEINGIATYDVNSFASTVQNGQLSGGVLLINRAGRSGYVTVPER